MPAAAVAAEAAIEQIAAGHHHEAVLKVKIEPFDKRLVLARYIDRRIIVHIALKTPCCPLPRGSVIR